MQNRLVVVLGVVAVALALAALVGPWWVVNANGSFFSGTFTRTDEYRPLGWTSTTLWDIFYTNVTNTSDYRYAPHIGAVFLVGAALTALGAVSGMGMVVFAAMSGSRPRLRRWGALLGLLAFVLALAALLYILALLPGAATQDIGAPAIVYSAFWGSGGYSFMHGGATTTWGAGWAWYALVAAAVLFLIGGILLFRARAPSAEQAAPKATQQP